MKKLLSTKYSAGAFSTAIFILRITVGALMLNHGYNKLIHFADMQPKFINFLGLGNSASLSLVIFAEFFCSVFFNIGPIYPACHYTINHYHGSGCVEGPSF